MNFTSTLKNPSRSIEQGAGSERERERKHEKKLMIFVLLEKCSKGNNLK